VQHIPLASYMEFMLCGQIFTVPVVSYAVGNTVTVRLLQL